MFFFVSLFHIVLTGAYASTKTCCSFYVPVGATNLRGGGKSVGDVTNRLNSKPPIRSTHFQKKEKAKEGEDEPLLYQ